MDVGIALPGHIPGVEREVVLEWARRADASPFASLGVNDRLVYGGWEPLICLTAAAALTTRVKLITHIVMSTLRNTALMAKEVATIDALSGGRLILGLGVGSREDEFQASGAPIHRRGRLMEEQIAAFRRVWAGQAIVEGVGQIGPPPGRAGGPPILMGGRTPNPLRRAGQLADGYIAGTGNTPEQLRDYYNQVLTAWKDAGRSGRPLMAAINYYALGEAATVSTGQAYLRDYYSFMGPYVERAVAGLLTTPEAIKETIQGYRGVGVDDYVLMPAVASLDQFDRLAEVVASF